MEGLVKSSSNPSHGQLVLLDRARPFFLLHFHSPGWSFHVIHSYFGVGLRGGGGRGTDVQSPIDTCYFQEQKNGSSNTFENLVLFSSERGRAGAEHDVPSVLRRFWSTRQTELWVMDTLVNKLKQCIITRFGQQRYTGGYTGVEVQRWAQRDCGGQMSQCVAVLLANSWKQDHIYIFTSIC